MDARRPLSPPQFQALVALLVGEAQLDPEQLLQIIDDLPVHTVTPPDHERKNAPRPAASSKRAGKAAAIVALLPANAEASRPPPAAADVMRPRSPHSPSRSTVGAAPPAQPSPLAVSRLAGAASLTWPDPGSAESSPSTSEVPRHRPLAPEPAPVPRVRNEAGLVEALRMLAVAHYVTVSEQKGRPGSTGSDYSRGSDHSAGGRAVLAVLPH